MEVEVIFDDARYPKGNENKNAALQAEKIVKEMRTFDQRLSSTTKVYVDTVTFNNVLHARSQQSKLPNTAGRAEDLLEYMIHSNDFKIAPINCCFNCVMDALSNSNEPHKGRRAREWLDRLKIVYGKTKRPNLKPTHIEYNTVLNACAFSVHRTFQDEQREALKIAVGTFASMPREGVERYTVSYGTMLKCFANLIPKGDVRSRMALQVFQGCCDEGLVGSLVWNETRRAVPLQVSCQLLWECGSLEVKDLPMEWRINNSRDKPKPQTTKGKQKQARSSKKKLQSSQSMVVAAKEIPKVSIWSDHSPRIRI
jgi:hypothetical protein